MLVLIMGPSGSGKSSVVDMLNYPELISTTTRSMREDEIDGIDYYFVDLNTFKTLDLVESTEYHGNYYGFQRKDVEECLDNSKLYISVVNKDGVKAMRKILGKDNVLAISLRATVDNLEKWMRKRGSSEDIIQDRLVGVEDEMLQNEVIADVCMVSSDLKELTKSINNCIIDRLRRLNSGPVKS